MNPLALNLNEQLNETNPNVLDMLSDLGKSMYYPKGILTQSAEAKSTEYNATIGMATNKDGKMFASSLNDMFNHLEPDELFAYAPPQGLEALRELWQNKMLKENPELSKALMSKPIVTNALTHGLSLVGDLVVNPNDTLLLPNHNWGNYRLVYGVRHQAHIETYPVFDEDGHYTTDGLIEALQQIDQEKVVLILNYPNNPTGYTPTKDEVQKIVEGINELGRRGVNVVAIVDDAYYGLFYEDVYTQSIFTALTNLQNEHVLPIRLDGATKEFFAWGFRVGFLTFGLKDDTTKNILEAKVKGLIRSNISSGPTPSQSAIKYVLEHPESFDKEIQANIDTLESRYKVTKEIVYKTQYQSLWQPYDFNSGYFMALKVKGVNAETLRVHLIENHSIGVIALNDTDIRVAFSCIEKDEIEHVFNAIAQAIQTLQAS
ncbi:aspartate aminotransferase [Staphylococcus felis]|uniref:Aminotransferase class I/II-fold pyridoxal phosphate-dependent enzyme n=1 Tax=Staphylococcus felis TaxID=46127 RepID=A0AAX1RUT7_9STAP|nr:aminotransferase class I/II-fold pyridoxal phosphate-dependent enzyme [Staphylococcus felis]MBH9580600.1 aminotransferase class I/II-fold pyridoxal phosphate-dependent enzyme [Staphylococcus felis]MDM8328206.1 aminotransferase class I/II-fold pyridoxal phosphate-dependent enzyme [Staphylococcus felis]MDQ7193564.1 aminotransferase class I/II-fold pyridoxal phosphate-dependent enzyme [Staphylococcus felis]REH80059.1 aspartate aminotransferase [Staphylococcus felis]REH83957.1 aspartate aminotr